MATDWRLFRKIAERPSWQFRKLPIAYRGVATEMVRYAARPDGRVADTTELEDVADMVHIDEADFEILRLAIVKLLAIGFLEERSGAYYIANFRDAQESRDAKRKRKTRDPELVRVVPDSADKTDSPGQARSVRGGADSLKDQTRPDQKRSDPPLPPAPSPTPKAPPVTDADPVAVRARNYERDATGRAFLGDPREWAEFKLVVSEYAKRFNSQPNLREYHRDNRTKAIVAALADYTPDQLRLAIREASRSKFSEDRFRQLDCVLHDSAKIDSWLDTAPPRAREAAAAGRLREFRRRAERPAEAEQTASSDRVPMPAEMVDRILGVKPAAKVAP